MICESCHQNSATVHLTEIVAKQKKEFHLCAECARERGDFKGTFSVKEFVGGLAESSKKKAAEKAGALVPKPDRPKLPDVGPCPACGISFEEFKRTGRLGCANDYEHFKKELLPLLEKIHGATQHTGRVPSRVGERADAQKVLAALRKDLSVAIQREEYERAAELRDKIKTLESAS